MLTLVHKFAKSSNNKQVHPHESEEEPSLSAFRWQISKFVAQLGFNLEQSRSQNLSLSWIHKCLGLLPIAHKAFAKLVVDLDHPISQWSSDSIEAYLGYSLGLLDLFNSISSSLSRLGRCRLSLSYGLIKFRKSPSSAMNLLKAIEVESIRLSPNFGDGLIRGSKKLSGKERVIQEAIEELKTIGFWVCGILLSALSGDANSYLELRKISGGFLNSSSVLVGLDSKIRQKLPVLKEVKEINDAVGDLVASEDAMKLDAAKELQKKVDAFQKVLDDLTKEADDVFNTVMTHRNEMIDCFRFRKPSQKSAV